jgi:Bifunctional DNA primase/polymerase, N-terminal
MNSSDCGVEEYETGLTSVEQEPVINPALHTMPLFPVKNKRPLMKGWQASPPISLNVVAEWESRYPGCGWGAAMTTDTMVIDCDSDAAVSALCDLGEIPATLTTLTPRGFHFWFHVPEAVAVRNRVRVMAGIDVRAKGGYVVVPPTDGYVFADTSAPVADAPDWILRLVMGDGVPGSVKIEPKPVRVQDAVQVPLDELTPLQQDMASRLWEKRTKPWKVTGGRSPFSLRIAMEPETVTKGTRNATLYAYLCRLRGEGKPELSIRNEAYRVVARHEVRYQGGGQEHLDGSVAYGGTD